MYLDTCSEKPLDVMNIRINDDDDEKKLTGSSRDPQRPSKMFRYLVVEGPPVT